MKYEEREMKKIRKQAKKLEKLYRKAGISVDFSEMTVDEILEKLGELSELEERMFVERYGIDLDDEF